MWVALAALLACVAVSASGDRVEASVCHTGGKFSVCSGGGGDVVATAWLADTFHSKGFAEFSVSTVEGKPDEVQAHGAGFAEGYLTAASIAHLHKRVSASRASSSKASVASLDNYVKRQHAFLVAEVAKHKSAAASKSKTLQLGPVQTGASLTWAQYWHSVGLVLAQVDGVVAGFNAARASNTALPEVTLHDILLLNYDGDLMDVMIAADSGLLFGAHGTVSAPRFARMSKGRLSSRTAEKLAEPAFDRDSWITLSRHGRCTALLTASRGTASPDVFAGHTTWSDFIEMVRVYKHYQLAYSAAAGPAHGKSASFSSYPAMVSSTDDWYTLSSGLLVTETTLSAARAGVLSRLTPEATVPAWVRTLVANRAAKAATDWVQFFSLLNSGTYNCAWFIVDYNVVKAAQSAAPAFVEVSAASAAAAAKVFQFDSFGAMHAVDHVDGCKWGAGDAAPWLRRHPNAVWMVEQSPARVLARDISGVLAAQGFVFSANRPYFHLIRSDLGYPTDLCTDTSSTTYYSYSHNPRGHVLARQAAPARTEADVQNALRWNQYTTDAATEHKPYLAPAARFDLAAVGDTHRAASGGTDTKTTNAALALRRGSHVVVGPTTDGVPAFDWRTWLAGGRLEAGLGVADLCDASGAPSGRPPCAFNFGFHEVVTG